MLVVTTFTLSSVLMMLIWIIVSVGWCWGHQLDNHHSSGLTETVEKTLLLVRCLKNVWTPGVRSMLTRSWWLPQLHHQSWTVVIQSTYSHLEYYSVIISGIWFIHIYHLWLNSVVVILDKYQSINNLNNLLMLEWIKMNIIVAKLYIHWCIFLILLLEAI